MIEDESAPYDMSIHSNSSALAWTKFFREHNPECNLDDDVMLGWFANAMMAMHDHIYQTTQPEQTEQEPAAWMYEWTNETGEIVKGVYVGSHKASHLYELANLVPLYLTPPKREHIVDVTDKVEPVAWMCNLLGNVITDKPADNNSYTPLYKSPPKRKTLSGKESEALWEAEFKSAISYLVFDEICVAINQYKG